MAENLEQKSKGEHPFGKGMITGAIIAALPIFMAGYAIGTGRAINDTIEEFGDIQRMEHNSTRQLDSTPKVNNPANEPKVILGEGVRITYNPYKDHRELNIIYADGNEVDFYDSKPFGDVDSIHMTGDGEYLRGTSKDTTLGMLSFAGADIIMEAVSKLKLPYPDYSNFP